MRNEKDSIEYSLLKLIIFNYILSIIGSKSLFTIICVLLPLSINYLQGELKIV